MSFIIYNTENKEASVGDKILAERELTAINKSNRTRMRDHLNYLHMRGFISRSHGKSSVLLANPLDLEEHY